MARYIDADKVLELFRFTSSSDDIIEYMQESPAANVVEVRHGEWIYKHRHRGGFERRTAYDGFNNPHTITLDNRYECDEPYCSVCGKLGGDFLNYCGNCGAKMDRGVSPEYLMKE